MATAHTAVQAVKLRLSKSRNSIETFHSLWYAQAKELAQLVGVPESRPITSSLMDHQNKDQSDSPEEYYRAFVSIPLLGVLYNYIRCRWRCFFLFYYVVLSNSPLIPTCKVRED